MSEDGNSLMALLIAVGTGMATRSAYGFLRRVTHLVWALAVLGAVVLGAVYLLRGLR